MARSSKRWGLLGQLGQLDFLGLLGGKEEEPDQPEPEARQADLQRTPDGATNQESSGPAAAAAALEHDGNEEHVPEEAREVPGRDASGRIGGGGGNGAAETPGDKRQATGPSDGSDHRPIVLTEAAVEQRFTQNALPKSQRMRRRWAACWKEKTMLGLQYTEMALEPLEEVASEAIPSDAGRRDAEPGRANPRARKQRARWRN